MDEHVIEALGKARVKIRNGKVVEVGNLKLIIVLYLISTGA